MTSLENFIFNNFGKMPLWLRCVTYLVFLFIILVMYLSPKDIDGVVKVKKNDNSFEQLPNIEIGYAIDGNYIAVRSGRSGEWRIPIVGSVVSEYVLQVRMPEGGRPRKIDEIQIFMHEVMLNRDVKIYYDEVNDIFYREQPAGYDDTASILDYSIDFSIFPIAYALSKEKAQLPVIDKEKIANDIKVVSEQDSIYGRASALKDLGGEYNSSEVSSIIYQSYDDTDKIIEGVVIEKMIESARLQTKPVYLYVGEFGSNNDWAELNFDIVDINFPERGGVIKSKVSVHERSDYIKWSWFKWRNAPALGVSEIGEEYLIDEVRRIGPKVWVKAYPITSE